MKKIAFRNVNYKLIRGGLDSLLTNINKGFTSIINIKTIEKTNRNIRFSL